VVRAKPSVTFYLPRHKQADIYPELGLNAEFIEQNWLNLPPN